jgi:hypothetical protein
MWTYHVVMLILLVSFVWRFCLRMHWGNWLNDCNQVYQASSTNFVCATQPGVWRLCMQSISFSTKFVSTMQPCKICISAVFVCLPILFAQCNPLKLACKSLDCIGMGVIWRMQLWNQSNNWEPDESDNTFQSVINSLCPDTFQQHEVRNHRWVIATNDTIF